MTSSTSERAHLFSCNRAQLPQPSDTAIVHGYFRFSTSFLLPAPGLSEAAFSMAHSNVNEQQTENKPLCEELVFYSLAWHQIMHQMVQSSGQELFPLLCSCHLPFSGDGTQTVTLQLYKASSSMGFLPYRSLPLLLLRQLPGGSHNGSACADEVPAAAGVT